MKSETWSKCSPIFDAGPSVILTRRVSMPGNWQSGISIVAVIKKKKGHMNK